MENNEQINSGGKSGHSKSTKETGLFNKSGHFCSLFLNSTAEQKIPVSFGC